eukprot:3180972-Pyramimonas_sp.AAC.1
MRTFQVQCKNDSLTRLLPSPPGLGEWKEYTLQSPSGCTNSRNTFLPIPSVARSRAASTPPPRPDRPRNGTTPAPPPQPPTQTSTQRGGRPGIARVPNGWNRIDAIDIRTEMDLN